MIRYSKQSQQLLLKALHFFKEVSERIKKESAIAIGEIFVLASLALKVSKYY